METNMENENIEPVVTESGLALGYSGYRIGRRSSSNDLGAGANAASRIDMTYMATDPLSEIVWSPHRGLCLKCTQCSFSKNKRSLVRGTGAVRSPEEMTSAARWSNEKPKDEEIIYTSSSTFPDLNTKVSDIDNSDKSTGDNDGIRSCHEPQTDNDHSFQGSPAFVNLEEKIDPRDSEDHQVADIAKPIENNIPSSPDGQKQDVALIESLFNDPRNEVGDVGDQTRLSRMQMVLVSKVHTENAENDLQGLSKDECVATSKLSGSESASEAEKNSQHHKGIFSKKMSGDKHSPTNSGIRGYRRKGKEKALSDGDVKGMVSKSEDDDSHDSVESCNSVAMFSAGKKRCGYEHQLIVESKRVKRRIHDESPCSSSFVKQDSSFMNWISNMMKVFMKSKDQIPPLALTTAVNINRSHDSLDDNLDAADKDQDLGNGNIDFQSIFHSIHSPKTKVHGTSQNENDQDGVELTNKICDIDATPIACHGENFNYLNVYNERFKKLIRGGIVGPPTRPKNSSMTLSPSKRRSEGNIVDNTNSSNLLDDVEKDRSSTSSSLGKRKMNSKNIDSDPPSEAKVARNIGPESNLLGSLWITRFTPNGSSSLLNRDTSGAVECLSDCMKLTPLSEIDVNVSSNLQIVETKLQCPQEPLTTSGKEIKEASIGLSTPRSKDSEPMASLFSRRLDALKHMMNSGVLDSRTSSTVTCFFCGRKGHHLQYCPEITDNEIGHLLRNMKSSSGFEELPRVCVRSFEHNHWAVSCPTARVKVNTKLLDEHQEAIVRRTVRGPSTLYEVTAEKMKSNINVNTNYVISSSKEIKRGNFINRQVSNTPKAIFDAVRMLRLSRTDILKWKNSQTSVSHLKGFFLRLRLAKWEKGLGGTGYYVAYITESNKQGTQRNSKKSIAVNVGGIKCLVESQYISNHDFLEDELTAWLQATGKSGGKIPSEEELTLKVKERIMLGF